MESLIRSLPEWAGTVQHGNCGEIELEELEAKVVSLKNGTKTWEIRTMMEEGPITYLVSSRTVNEIGSELKTFYNKDECQQPSSQKKFFIIKYKGKTVSAYFSQFEYLMYVLLITC